MNGYGLSLENMLAVNRTSQNKNQQKVNIDIPLSEYKKRQQDVQPKKSTSKYTSHSPTNRTRGSIANMTHKHDNNNDEGSNIHQKENGCSEKETLCSSKELAKPMVNSKDVVKNRIKMLKDSPSFRLAMYGKLQECEHNLTSEETFKRRPEGDNTITVTFHGTSFKADHQKRSLESTTERFRASILGGISKKMRLLSYEPTYDQLIGLDVGLLKVVLRQMPRQIKTNQCTENQTPWYKSSNKENSMSKIVLPIAKEINKYINMNILYGLFRGALTISINLSFIEESDVKLRQVKLNTGNEFRIFLRGKHDVGTEFSLDATSNDAAVQVAKGNKKQMPREFGRIFELTAEQKFDCWQESKAIRYQIEQFMEDSDFEPMKRTGFLKTTSMPDLINTEDSDDEEVDDMTGALHQQNEKLINLLMSVIALYNSTNEKYSVGETDPRDIECLVFIIRILGSRLSVPAETLVRVERSSIKC